MPTIKALSPINDGELHDVGAILTVSEKEAAALVAAGAAEIVEAPPEPEKVDLKKGGKTTTS